METVQVTPLRRTLASSPNPNALVAISKGMRAVKLYFFDETCSSYLTVPAKQVVLHNGSRIIVVKLESRMRTVVTS